MWKEIRETIANVSLVVAHQLARKARALWMDDIIQIPTTAHVFGPWKHRRIPAVSRTTIG